MVPGGYWTVQVQSLAFSTRLYHALLCSPVFPACTKAAWSTPLCSSPAVAGALECQVDGIIVPLEVASLRGKPQHGKIWVQACRYLKAKVDGLLVQRVKRSKKEEF